MRRSSKGGYRISEPAGHNRSHASGHRTTYLITGGAGFIGSHLAEALLARGDRVIVLDDLSTGSMSNLAGMADHPGLLTVTGSIRDELVVDELMHKCDVVVHLAAAVGVRLIIEEPLRSFTTNIRGSEVVIEAAHRYQRPILIASTSEVYGKNGHSASSETADRILGTAPPSPRWAYSTAKAVDEILALTYHRERGLPAVVTRLFNTVGPRQSAAYGMVIPDPGETGTAGRASHRFGDGQQSRCFCHVADTVDALLRVLDNRRAVGSVFNVGSTEEIRSSSWPRPSWRRRARAPRNPAGPLRRGVPRGVRGHAPARADISKIEALTGWRPRHTLDDILADTIADIQKEFTRYAGAEVVGRGNGLVTSSSSL